MNKLPSDDKKPKYPPSYSMRFTEDERRVLEMAAAGLRYAFNELARSEPADI